MVVMKKPSAYDPFFVWVSDIVIKRDLSLLTGARERLLHIASQRQSLNPDRQSAFSTSGMGPIRREVCFTFYGGNLELRLGDNSCFNPFQP